MRPPAVRVDPHRRPQRRHAADLDLLPAVAQGRIDPIHRDEEQGRPVRSAADGERRDRPALARLGDARLLLGLGHRADALGDASHRLLRHDDAQRLGHLIPRRRRTPPPGPADRAPGSSRATRRCHPGPTGRPAALARHGRSGRRNRAGAGCSRRPGPGAGGAGPGRRSASPPHMAHRSAGPDPLGPAAPRWPARRPAPSPGGSSLAGRAQRRPSPPSARSAPPPSGCP